jgi:hypothetical protein
MAERKSRTRPAPLICGSGRRVVGELAVKRVVGQVQAAALLADNKRCGTQLGGAAIGFGVAARQHLGVAVEHEQAARVPGFGVTEGGVDDGVHRSTHNPHSSIKCCPGLGFFKIDSKKPFLIMRQSLFYLCFLRHRGPLSTTPIALHLRQSQRFRGGRGGFGELAVGKAAE